MKTIVLALFLAPLIQAYDGAPIGNPDAGKTAWRARRCRSCHGEMGEGGFGPDLAGRGLTYNQFRQAVRKPWGVMPAFTENQASDQVIADMQAYVLSLPKVEEPAAWFEKPPPQNAPNRQQLFFSFGCAQCHGPEGQTPREILAGEAADNNFPYFAKMVYTHTERFPDGRMGNFSRAHLPEAVLQEIYHFMFEDLGYLAPFSATIKPGASTGDNTVYTLELGNQGLKGKGVTPEDLTIALALAPGTKVVSGTGAGYQGVRNDSPMKSAAIWQVPSIAPGEKQVYTLTIAGSGGNPADIFKGSVVRWTKPEIRKGLPNLARRDPRIPGNDPQTPVTFPSSPAPRH